MPTLMERVEGLERHNRRMRRVATLLLAALACVVLVGQGKTGARAFEGIVVKDAKGATRIRMGTAADGSPVIRLIDAKGAGLVTLGLSADGPFLSFADAGGKERLNLSLIRDGQPAVFLQDKGAKRRAVLLMDAVMMTDKDGQPRVLVSTRDEKPQFSLLDPSRTARAVLATSAAGEPFLALYDRAGASRAVVGVTGTVNKATGEQARRPESTLTLLDAKGAVLWQAPR